MGPRQKTGAGLFLPCAPRRRQRINGTKSRCFAFLDRSGRKETLADPSHGRAAETVGARD
jgi:hypothetical protein